jgi:nucleoside-diphosphate-sugar epimerase
VQQIVIGDLAEGSLPAKALRGVDVVVHAAARTHVLSDRASDPYAAYRHVNLGGTLNLARSAIANDVRRVVFLSSIKVNGESTLIGRPFTEADNPAPEDAYGLTNLEAERALEELAEAGALEVRILRLPLVYGPGAKGNLLQLMRLIDWGVPLPLGLVRNQRSMIALDNLVSAILASASPLITDSATHLISDQHDLSTPELVAALAHGLGRSPRLWPLPPSLLTLAAGLAGRSDQARRLLGSLTIDSSRATRDLGWRPSVRPRRGLADMARHYARLGATAGADRPLSGNSPG